jgi:hypothetical protein
MTTPQSSTVTAVNSIIDKQLNFAVHGYELRPRRRAAGAEHDLAELRGADVAIEHEFDIELPDEVLNENTFRSVNAIAPAIDGVLYVKQ